MLHSNTKNISNAARGAISCVQWYDEFAFIPANSTVDKVVEIKGLRHHIASNTNTGNKIGIKTQE